ncbi:MAG: hypothetical protein MJ180_05460, partial [Candidatus Gastranaerophilales bacterium]|nr:hypothetical protein [Candidatus Gastranaerophilales bacterium]
MLSVNANITSLIAQNNLTKSNNALKTSIERLSTGFKINRASDDAANMAVSKNMSCQISGTNVALDNTQQAINLVQTADAALGEMQDMAQRMRELCVQAANGTYSDKERGMINQEIKSLLSEIYQQRNCAKFNEIYIFGEEELPPWMNAGPEVAETPVENSAVEHPILRSAPRLMSANPYTAPTNADETLPPTGEGAVVDEFTSPTNADEGSTLVKNSAPMLAAAPNDTSETNEEPPVVAG